ncbi:hypothetical protein FACS1894109_11080 [Spirochaetia bacterium]|nr:hypothetical protein FACS1894109_11080 [Spirochaetia bacterium]
MLVKKISLTKIRSIEDIEVARWDSITDVWKDSTGGINLRGYLGREVTIDLNEGEELRITSGEE